MRIAFTTKGTDWESQMDPRFGRTEFILIFDEDQNILEHFNNQDIENEAHGAGTRTAQKLFELKPDVLITGNGPGGNAGTILEKSNVKIFVGAGEMNVKQSYQAFKNNELKTF